jgi:hypothetical protein
MTRLKSWPELKSKKVGEAVFTIKKDGFDVWIKECGQAYRSIFKSNTVELWVDDDGIVTNLPQIYSR